MAGGPIRLDDFKSLQMQVFIATVEESSQQRQRTPRPLDQGGFGVRPDLRVVGYYADITRDVTRFSQSITWAEFLD